MTLEASAITIETADAAGAAYIMSELVGRFGAGLVVPSTSGGRWAVVLRRDRDERELLIAAISAVERSLRLHDLPEAVVRFGPRSYTIRNPDAIPPRAAA
jgi:hypothetical protein